MKQLFALVPALPLALALAGCASGYKQFYTPVQFSGTAASLPYAAPPELKGSSGNSERDIAYMWSEGFAPVGYSSFNGPAESQSAALKQAKAVGARFVVVDARYVSTITGSIPVTTPTTSTSYTSGTVSSGRTSGTYSGTVTTRGSTTSYIPYSIDRYDQSAVYFAPLERRGLGTYGAPVSPQQARQIGTNKGYYVEAVRRGSPAFDADILPGDVLLEINSAPIMDFETYRTALRAAYGTRARILVLRGGRRVAIEVPLSADGSW